MVFNLKIVLFSNKIDQIGNRKRLESAFIQTIALLHQRLSRVRLDLFSSYQELTSAIEYFFKNGHVRDTKVSILLEKINDLELKKMAKLTFALMFLSLDEVTNERMKKLDLINVQITSFQKTFLNDYQSFVNFLKYFVGANFVSESRKQALGYFQENINDESFKKELEQILDINVVNSLEAILEGLEERERLQRNSNNSN